MECFPSSATTGLDTIKARKTTCLDTGTYSRRLRLVAIRPFRRRVSQRLGATTLQQRVKRRYSHIGVCLHGYMVQLELFREKPFSFRDALRRHNTLPAACCSARIPQFGNNRFGHRETEENNIFGNINPCPPSALITGFLATLWPSLPTAGKGWCHPAAQQALLA